MANDLFYNIQLSDLSKYTKAIAGTVNPLLSQNQERIAFDLIFWVHGIIQHRLRAEGRVFFMTYKHGSNRLALLS